MKRDHNEFVFSVDGQSMEFVLNNGRDDWDQPFPVDDKQQNYIIKESGEFFLRHGTLQKL